MFEWIERFLIGHNHKYKVIESSYSKRWVNDYSLQRTAFDLPERRLIDVTEITCQCEICGKIKRLST